MSLATYAAPFNEDNNKSKIIPQKINSKKVNNLLSKIHDGFDDSNNLADFTPPPMPKSSGVQKTVSRESSGSKSVPEYAEFYNSKVESFQPYFQPNSNAKEAKDDELNKKLENIIRLLEQQQDSSSEHVMEEIILYSFFGIFIIYLVDSFKRLGKYTR